MGEIDEFSELEKELTENSEQIKLELRHNEDDFEYSEKGFKNRNFLHNSYKISIIIFGIGLIISLFFIITFKESSSGIWGDAMADGYRMALNLFCTFCFGILTCISLVLFLFTKPDYHY